MVERTVTSTVEIDAPFETVFDYAEDPQRAEKAMQASASGRFSHISNVRRDPDGSVTSYQLVTPIAIESRIDEMLELVGLSGKADRPITTLSAPTRA